MGKARKESPAASTPPLLVATAAPAAATSTTGKVKRKTVTWAPEGQLESIRLIERAVYDDDPVDVSSLLHLLVYSTLMSHVLSLFIRVYILLTVFAILIEGKARRCTHTCLKSSLTGQIQYVGFFSNLQGSTERR